DLVEDQHLARSVERALEGDRAAARLGRVAREPVPLPGRVISQLAVGQDLTALDRQRERGRLAGREDPGPGVLLGPAPEALWGILRYGLPVPPADQVFERREG